MEKGDAGESYTPGVAVSNIGSQTVTGETAEEVAASSQVAINAVASKLNALLLSLRMAGVIAE